ncbi:MAG: thioesterase [Bacteroidales bacterium]|nr:thioesterase [Bacteroidales bacterium]
METKLTRKHHVACYNTDQLSRMKLAALLDFAQDMAGDHADILGFGDEVLAPQHIAWVLSRIKVHMDEYPHWRDEIEITTWHRGLDGPFYIRDYQVRDSKGTVIGAITTSWVLLNIDERRMIRSAIATEEEGICHDIALEPVASRLRLPREIEMEECGQRVVSYSDIDKNEHTNNVRYTVWAIDCLDRQLVTENPIRSFEINFIREARPNETVDLRKGCVTDENGVTSWYVEGLVEGQQSFICRIQF